jgi:hypothetical protein
MQSGHTVVVWDARYFANFGHFHYQGHDVMMPFWVSSQIKIPGTNRTLLVPVSHAEYEWEIRGPKINADVSWYFGIDGKAEFRTMDTLDQPWVLGRHAHEYRNAAAAEVTRLTGAMSVAYMHQHRARRRSSQTPRTARSSTTHAMPRSTPSSRPFRRTATEGRLSQSESSARYRPII